MSETVPDLHGVTLLAPPRDDVDHMDALMAALSPEYRDHLRVESATLEIAQGLGATVISDPRGEAEFHRSHLSQPDTYTLRGSRSFCEEKLKELDSLPEARLRQPRRKPYLACTDEELHDLPLFLASIIDGGEGKYLIDNPDQLARFAALNQHYHDQPVSHLFEVREYIPTPSTHYTSYRVLASAAGEIIAAGLLYSPHTEDQQKRLSTPLNNWDTAGSSKIAPLENPVTPYFINALDARSNIQRGGTSIPLMGGEKSRLVTTAEEEILAAHDIAPFNVESTPATRSPHRGRNGSTRKVFRSGRGARLLATPRERGILLLGSE